MAHDNNSSMFQAFLALSLSFNIKWFMGEEDNSLGVRHQERKKHMPRNRILKHKKYWTLHKRQDARW